MLTLCKNMCKHGVIVFEALRHLCFISLVTLLDLFYWATFRAHTSFNRSCHGLFVGSRSYYIVTIHHILTHWLLGELGTLCSQIRVFLLLIIFHTFHSHASCHCQLHLFLFLAHAHRISFIAAWHWLRLNRLHIRLLLSAAAKHWINATHYGTTGWSESSSYTIVNACVNLLLLLLLLSSVVLHQHLAISVGVVVCLRSCECLYTALIWSSHTTHIIIISSWHGIVLLAVRWLVIVLKGARINHVRIFLH